MAGPGRADPLPAAGRHGQARPAHPLAGTRQRLVEEAGGPAELLLLEQGNHGCANLAPFHRYRTADWAASAERLGRASARG